MTRTGRALAALLIGGVVVPSTAGAAAATPPRAAPDATLRMGAAMNQVMPDRLPARSLIDAALAGRRPACTRRWCPLPAEPEGRDLAPGAAGAEPRP